MAMKTKLLIFLLFIALGTSVTTCQDTSQTRELYAAGRFLTLTGKSTIFSSSGRAIQLLFREPR